MNLKLYLDYVNGQIVAGPNRAEALALPPLVFQDKVRFELHLVEPRPAGFITSGPYQAIDVTGFTIEMYLGQRGQSAEAGQNSWTIDEVNDLFTGTLDLNTTQLDTALGSATEIERILEIRVLQGSERFTLHRQVKVRAPVQEIGAPAPTEYEPPANLVSNLAAILADSDDIDVVQAGSTFEFNLKAAGRPTSWPAANQAAMLALVARKGDWARRADTNRWWNLTTSDPTQLANWQEAPVGFVWQGDWSAVATYAVDAGVSKNGWSYISLQAANLNHDPADIANIGVWWDVLAAGSTVQLATAPDPVPSELTEQAASSIGTSSKAAREDHVHKSQVATQTVSGRHSAADKLKSDMSLGPYIGGFNGAVAAVFMDGERIICTGAFTAYSNTPAPGIIILDRHGLPMPDFAPGTGFTAGVALDLIAKASDGSYILAKSGVATSKTSYRGAADVWLHKIDVTGAPDPAFTSPAAIASAGTDALRSIACTASRIWALATNTVRVLNLTGGDVVVTATGWSSVFNLATKPGTDLVMMSTAADTSFGGYAVPAALRLLDATLTRDADWVTGAGAGSDTGADRMAWSPNGDFIIAGNGENVGIGTYEWDGGAANKHKNLFKINADGTEAADWTATIVMHASAIVPCVPQFVDSQGRIYFTGYVSTIDGTAVTANRLYRLNLDGSFDRQFNGFNGTVVTAVAVDDDHILVAGEFTAYGTAPVGRMVFIDADGKLIPTLDEDVTGAQSVAITGAGTTPLEITGGGVQSLVVTVTDTYGGSAFTHTLILPDFGATEGDRLFARFILPASIDPAINVISPTADGSTLLAFNSLSLVSELTARFVFRNAAWELEDFSWHTADGAPAQNLFTRGTTTYAAAVAIDLDGASYQEITATGALEISTKAASRGSTGRAKSVSLLITASGGDRAITFAAGIKGIGDTLPSGKTAAVCLLSTGTNESNTLAAYAQLD